MHREQPPQSWWFLSLGSAEALREPVDLSELLLEIRHLRLQLERSIQTNTALRERLEEQLLRGHKHSETININYLLSSLGKDTALTPAGHVAPLGKKKKNTQLWQRVTLEVKAAAAFTFVSDEGGRSPGREDCDRQSFQGKNSVCTARFSLSFSFVLPINNKAKLKPAPTFILFRREATGSLRGRRCVRSLR